MKTAARLNNFKAYAGPAMNQKIALMRAEGSDVINLGLGDPDTTPTEHQLRSLAEAVSDPNNHHYPSAYPIKPFYHAIGDWYKRRHEVDVDPESEIIYCLGAAEGLFHVRMIPGSAYGERGKGYVRIANAQPLEWIAEGVDRIKKFIIALALK
jgi:aspartate/methionine/tyrosine aminotransferase